MKILCFIAGHRYLVHKKLSTQTVQLRCDDCGKLMAYNHQQGIGLPWDIELDSFYEELAKRKH